MTLHELKIWPVHFLEHTLGDKNFELRKNDRDFLIFDEVLLKEWSEEKGYTGRIFHRRITGVLKDMPGLEDGYVILTLRKM